MCVCVRKITGLFKGMSAPLASACVINAIYFGTYGNILKMLSANDQNIPASFGKVCMAGTMAGAIQLAVCCPVELVKVQLQMNTGKYTKILDIVLNDGNNISYHSNRLTTGS